MNRFSTAVLVSWLFSQLAIADINRIDPPNWWAGMVDPNLQLMLYGPAISDLDVTTDYPGAQVVGVTVGDSENYLFIDIVLEDDIKRVR